MFTVIVCVANCVQFGDVYMTILNHGAAPQYKTQGIYMHNQASNKYIIIDYKIQQQKC